MDVDLCVVIWMRWRQMGDTATASTKPVFSYLYLEKPQKDSPRFPGGNQTSPVTEPHLISCGLLMPNKDSFIFKRYTAF